MPKKLWRDEGRRVVQHTLGTTDLRAAQALARREASILDERWGILAHTTRVPTDEDLEEAAVAIAHDIPADLANAARTTLQGKGLHMWKAHVSWVQSEASEQAQRTATGDSSAVRDIADEAIEALGFDLPINSQRYEQFCRLLNQARLAQLTIANQHNLGRLDAETDDRLVQRVRQRDSAKAQRGETISELFEEWSADRLAKKEKRADTVDQDRKIIKQFSEFVDADRSIDSISAREVAEYRDILRRLPPKWRSHSDLRDLDIRQASRRASQLGLKPTAFTTVNKHLSTISPLYKWLGAQPRWAGLINPVTGLFHDGVKGKNPRPPFSGDDLNLILHSPLFTGFRADGKEYEPGTTKADDWRKWLPLLCLFTGARIGEIAQLRIGDVRSERGVWFAHIREDEALGLKTKSRKSRPAVLHVLLERIGFLNFHARQNELAGAIPDHFLFPELVADQRAQIGGKPSRWWRDYLKNIGLKQSADGYGSHSFRHTLTDRLRSEAELLDDQIEVVLGHNQKTVTSGYGILSQGTVTMLKGWMDKVIFDGVDFSPLLQSCAVGRSAERRRI